MGKLEWGERVLLVCMGVACLAAWPVREWVGPGEAAVEVRSLPDVAAPMGPATSSAAWAPEAPVPVRARSSGLRPRSGLRPDGAQARARSDPAPSGPDVWSVAAPAGAPARAGAAPDPVPASARDLAVLRELIEANGLAEDTSQHDGDDGDGALGPRELGTQVWEGGRLVVLRTGPNPHFSYGYELRRLPASIGRLSHLRELDLSGNRLTTLPPEIGLLSRLETLRLYRNALVALPPELGRLRRLRTLILDENRLASLPPELGGLERLESLHLHDNPLVSLPAELGALRRLRLLTVQRDPRTAGGLGALPETLDDLTALRVLHVGGNALGCDAPLPRFLLDGSIEEVYGIDHQRCAPSPPAVGSPEGAEPRV